MLIVINVDFKSCFLEPDRLKGVDEVRVHILNTHASFKINLFLDFFL